MKIDFDNFVESYVDQTQAQTNFFNKDRTYFDLYKIKLLKNVGKSFKPKKILDFGCGIGLCLEHFLQEFKTSQIYAYDDSKKSQIYAKKKYPKVKFLNKKNLEKQKFDLIFISGVLHHVKPKSRKKLILRINKMLKNSGKLFITEHNPYNPITRKIVSECAYDKDASLLKKKQLSSLLKNNNFGVSETGYYLYFPELLSFFRPLEKLLKWLPLGGQYFVFAHKEKSKN